MSDSEIDHKQWRWLYTIGGVTALLQLASIIFLAIVMATLGPRPTSALDFFTIQQNNRLESLLRGDFLLLILVGAYLFTFPALYLALRGVSPVFSALATLMTLVGVAVFFTAESSFSLLYLGSKYTQAATEVQRAQLLAAGEAVIASDIWNSSGAYMSGILLQGAGVIISLIMLHSKDFSKVTAYAGLLGNGFDLIQHIIHPFAPSVSLFISSFMGLFYFVWFPMLSRDLLRLGSKN